MIEHKGRIYPSDQVSEKSQEQLIKDITNNSQVQRATPLYPNLAGNFEASSIVSVLKERGSRYGKFKNHAEITQKLKNIFSDHMKDHNDQSLSLSQKEAISMIFHKLGRIANGDPNYVDSWVDIVGYAQLIVDELNGVIR